MATLQIPIAPGRMSGEGDRVLGNEVAGVPQNQIAECADFLLAGPWSHEHAIASRLIGRLDHKFIEVFQDVFAILAFTCEKGVHILQDGIFTQIILDDLGNKAVDNFIVSDSRSDAVCQADISGTVGIHESRNSE